MGAGQGSGLEPLLAELRNPSARARANALERLGELGRPDAAAPIAAMLADGNDGVQGAAINALLSLYTVRTDLRQRQWGPGSVGKSATPSEVAFEAGPLATMPAAVPAQALTGLSGVVRQDQSVKTRLEAAYALGTLGVARDGPDGRGDGKHRGGGPGGDAAGPGSSHAPGGGACRRPGLHAHDGRTVPASLGDALINSMNDGDPLVRRWAMDSLGWLKYDRAVQALTDRASYYGKSEEGSAALHGLARIASPRQRAGVPCAAGQQRVDLPRHLHRGPCAGSATVRRIPPSPSRR